jgi:hypothetical protein
MGTSANFKVDPQLAALLGEVYRSTEQALKELVDNAWDADATRVDITVPESMTDASVVVADNGCGMTEAEVRTEYLSIANDRRSRKGERTALWNRPVKGRKGIGKFAGLVVANHMELTTRAKAARTRLVVSKAALLASTGDLEHVDLPIEVVPAGPLEHGAEIRLTDLNGRFAFPDPGKLRQLLVLEYGREKGVTITVNGEPIGHEDLPGKSFTVEEDVPGAGKMTLRFTLLDSTKGVKQPGIVLRVGGKVVGRPGFYGLDEREDIPKKLLGRLVGEIECDGVEPDVTANWGAIVENSTAFREVQERVRREVGGQMERVFRDDVSTAKARLKKEHYRRIETLPEHRRAFAERALDDLLRKFYGEAEDKVDTMVSLVLDAFEKDEYWTVCRRIDDARHSDVARFAEALEDYGLYDMAVMVEQAVRRKRVLDDLDALANNPETLEQQMHQALEKNLWVFGVEYSLMASNVTLATVVETHLNAKFAGKRANKRPDLFMAADVLRRHLLVEFKRPDHTLGRDDEAQAMKYRDDLTPGFGTMDVLLVAGKVNPKMSAHYDITSLKCLSYAAVFSNARAQLEWLIRELTTAR